MRLILASSSPRRHALLSLLQVSFDIVEPDDVEQPRPHLDPAALATLYAERKARSCADRFPGCLVLGSDTLIALEDRRDSTPRTEVLGKPADLAEARAMLRRLRGQEHVIHTAVALICQRDGVADRASEQVRVWMRQVSDTEIEAYLRTEESLGKAGAYSIQGEGARLIAGIQGDFTAAVGLPLRLVADLLQQRGVRLSVDVEALYRARPYPNWDRFAPQRAG
jgi:septum formation protein